MIRDEAVKHRNELDVFDLMLISPILRSETIKQARARARAARTKLARYDRARASQLGYTPNVTSDDCNVLDRIGKAEGQTVAKIIEREGVDDAVQATRAAREEGPRCRCNHGRNLHAPQGPGFRGGCAAALPSQMCGCRQYRKKVARLAPVPTAKGETK